MADRTVKVTLIAQATGYIQGMEQAAQKTREVGTETEKLAQKRQSFQHLGMAAIAFGAALALGIGLAVAKYAEFDQAMSNANAILQETTANQELLRDAALEAGGATVFTATESANAIEELGKAGIGTSDILSGALTGSLNLAASAQLEVARAAEISGITLKQFNLDGSQAGRVADVLSAGANKAVGSVEDLANGLKFVGPVANSMNVSLEDTVATLALFADQGIIGEQAGTSLRGMLSSLTSPSSAASKEIARLGIELYDANGKFLGLENATAQLHQALGNATDAERDMSLGIIFGNQQVTAARVLVDAGAESWRDYRNSVDDSGIAARIAAERMDNLAGDVEKLGGAFDTALIQTGSGANDVLRGIVQSATFLVDAVGELPEPVLNAGLVMAALTAAVLLATGVAFTSIPKWAAFKNAIKDIDASGRAAATGIGVASAAISVATIIIGALIAKEAEHKAQVDSFVDSFDEASGAVTKYTRSLAVKRLEEVGALKSAEDLGVSTEDLVEALLAGPEATQKFIDGIHGGGLAAGDLAQDLYLVSGELEDGRKAWERQTDAQGKSEDQTGKNERALAAFAGQADDASGAVEALTNALRGFNDQQFAADDAAADFHQAVLDLNEAMGADGFTGTLDQNTQEGIDNARMLRDIAEKANNAAAEAYALTKNQDDATTALSAGRAELERVGEQFGLSGDALQAFIDKYLASPKDFVYQANLQGLPEMQAQIDKFFDKNTGRSLSWGGRITLPDGTKINPGMFYRGGIVPNAVGNMYGFPSGIYAGRTGGIHKFAESEMGVPWETYISGRPQDHDRNVGIWAETGERLGVWRQVPSAGVASPAQSGPVTAYVDPSFVRAVEQLAHARRADLDTVGLAAAASAGSSRMAAGGAS
jgi:TP901 family phage tail tape measure protein